MHILAYADDTISFLATDNMSLSTAFGGLMKEAKKKGLEINENITKIMLCNARVGNFQENGNRGL